MKLYDRIKNSFYLQWIILSVCALNVIFLGGKRRAFGSFVANLKVLYPNVTLTELNWIGDSYSALGYMITSLTTWMIIRYGRKYRLSQTIGAFFVLCSCLSSAVVPNPHWLFLTHTALHGIGSGCILATIGLVINEYFPIGNPYRVLATTLSSGGSVASIIFVEAFAALINSYGWRLSFVVLGIVYFIVNISAALVLFRQNDIFVFIESNNPRRHVKVPKLTCYDIVNKKILVLSILWFIDRVLTSVVTYGMLMNLTYYLYEKGDEDTDLVDSSILTTLFAAGEAVTYLIGAIVTGLTRDWLRNRLKYILITSSIGLSICLMSLGITAETITAGSIKQTIIVFFAGLCLGPSITFLFPAGEEMTKLPGTIAYPLSLSGMGFGMIISPLLTARIAETISYKYFFYVQGGLVILKVLMLLIGSVLSWYTTSPENSSPEEYENLL